MEKVLVLRGGALGDFLVTLPALAALRERWPRARIELAGNAVAAQLARARGLLDAVHSQHEARWGALYGEAPLPPELAGWLGTFDLVLSYWPDPEGELRRRFPCHPGQTYLHAAAMPAEAPAAAHYCAPLRELGLAPRAYVYRLDPLPEARTAASDGPASDAPIVIHPGSGSPRKNWPVARWLALLATLPGPATVVLGEAEVAAGTADRLTGAPGVGEILLQPPLETLVGRLARCALFVGHDSGISHLAAQCGAPAVLLFGPTAPSVWAPPAPSVRVLQRGPDPRAIPVEEVRAAVAAALADRR